MEIRILKEQDKAVSGLLTALLASAYQHTEHSPVLFYTEPVVFWKTVYVTNAEDRGLKNLATGEDESLHCIVCVFL
jgi:hypothetical protein